MSTAVAERINGNGGIITIPSNDARLSFALRELEIDERMFALAQQKASMYSESTLVPKEYQKNVSNVLIAMNIANRIGADPLMVMQNLYIVYGRPGWSAKFLVGTFNTCGRFSAIRYRMNGTPGQPGSSCVAYTKELSSGDEITGTTITWELAKAEGWVDKSGSKWKTMPEQMMRYRAASWLINTTAPEVGLGLYTKEELEDIGEVQSPRVAPTSLDALTEQISGSATATVDTATAEAARDPSGAMSDTATLFGKFKSKLALIDMLKAVDELYDKAFGPDSTIEWTAEQNNEAAELVRLRKEAISASRKK